MNISSLFYYKYICLYINQLFLPLFPFSIPLAFYMNIEATRYKEENVTQKREVNITQRGRIRYFIYLLLRRELICFWSTYESCVILGKSIICYYLYSEVKYGKIGVATPHT